MTRSEARRPLPTLASKEGVHRFAEEVGQKVGYHPGFSIEPIVTELGGSIVHLSPFAVGGEPPPSIYVVNNRKFTIYLPITTAPRRNRFTIAHELGHLFLHYPMVQRDVPGAAMEATRWVNEDDADQRRAEWEANWFAAGFLMPENHFRELCRVHNNDRGAIAEALDVSEPAVHIRARNMGLAIS